ncbi:hypothetical protein H9660_12000 [Clostridium sp. Sa3CUN1]|uniref:Uncharacterized protein n=1 Tax=Clostridium gallinarum TaxID=2762246 RepID=A0ABR8Q620_9CLOT|nr:hypothetical protein [Clostridium gallinarum]MBD7915867.1 hypothetical protein [Clostridium gallinarum]
MSIFLAALYISGSIFVLVGLFAELLWYRSEAETFELKRYHVLEVIIFPLSAIIFLLIILIFYLIAFIFKSIAVFFQRIGGWLNEPFNKEKRESK